MATNIFPMPMRGDTGEDTFVVEAADSFGRPARARFPISIR